MKKLISRSVAAVSVLFFILCLIAPVQARMVHRNSENVYDLDDENYNLSIRTGVGYVTGTANEYVYRGSFSENNLSRLTWDIDDLYMGNLGASVQKQWVAVHGDVWLRLFDGEGTMDNYDWLTDSPSWSDWSHHDDTEITDAKIFDINAELLIPRLSGKNFVLSAFLGYKYETFKWEARGGSYVYSSEGGFRDLVGEFPAGQLGISYEQTYKTPYIGLGFRGNLNNFEISGRFIGSTLASGEAEDIHHLRNTEFVDRSVDGDMYAFDLTASYRFLKSYSLALSYNFTSYDEMKGNTTIRTVAEDQTIDAVEYLNSGGMDLETSVVSLTFMYTF